MHRDVKPANVMIDEGEVARVADFGLALDALQPGQITRGGQILGTPAFMSPEQIRSASEVGPASDVYSTGGMLYFALTGEQPFSGGSLQELVLQIASEEPRPPRELNPEIPRDLELIVLKCLEKRAEDRYADGGALAAELQRFLEGRAVEVRPPTPPERFWRAARRNPAAAAVALLATGVLLLVVAGFSVRVFSLIRELEEESQSARQAERESRAAAQREALAAEREEGQRRAAEGGQERAERALAETRQARRQMLESLARVAISRGELGSAAARIAELLRGGESPSARSLCFGLGYERRGDAQVVPGSRVRSLVALAGGGCLGVTGEGVLVGQGGGERTPTLVILTPPPRQAELVASPGGERQLLVAKDQLLLELSGSGTPLSHEGVVLGGRAAAWLDEERFALLDVAGALSLWRVLPGGEVERVLGPKLLGEGAWGRCLALREGVLLVGGEGGRLVSLDDALEQRSAWRSPEGAELRALAPVPPGCAGTWLSLDVEGRLTLWGAAGERLASWRGRGDALWSLAPRPQRSELELAVGTRSGRLRTLRLREGRFVEVATRQLAEDWDLELAWSADGTRLYAGGRQLHECSSELASLRPSLAVSETSAFCPLGDSNQELALVSGDSVEVLDLSGPPSQALPSLRIPDAPRGARVRADFVGEAALLIQSAGGLEVWVKEPTWRLAWRASLPGLRSAVAISAREALALDLRGGLYRVNAERVAPLLSNQREGYTVIARAPGPFRPENVFVCGDRGLVSRGRRDGTFLEVDLLRSRAGTPQLLALPAGVVGAVEPNGIALYVLEHGRLVFMERLESARAATLTPSAKRLLQQRVTGRLESYETGIFGRTRWVFPAAPLRSIARTPEGVVLSLGEGERAAAYYLNGSEPARRLQPGVTRALAVAPGGSLIALASGGEVELRSEPSAPATWTRSFAPAPEAVSLSEQGQLYVLDGEGQVWLKAAGAAEAKPIFKVAAEPRARTRVSADERGVAVWGLRGFSAWSPEGTSRCRVDLGPREILWAVEPFAGGWLLLRSPDTKPNQRGEISGATRLDWHAAGQESREIGRWPRLCTVLSVHGRAILVKGSVEFHYRRDAELGWLSPLLAIGAPYEGAGFDSSGAIRWGVAPGQLDRIDPREVWVYDTPEVAARKLEAKVLLRSEGGLVRELSPEELRVE